MKNLFGSDEPTGASNAEKFVLRTTENTEAGNKLYDVLDRNWTAVRQTALPFWLLIAAFVFIVGGLIMIAFLTAAETDEEMRVAFIVATVGVSLTVAGLIILLINYLKMRKLKASAYFQSLLDEEKKAEELCLEYLNVPKDAEDIQVLVTYENKKNPLYSAQLKKIYKDDCNLYFADSAEVVGVPFDEITSIYTVKTKTKFYTGEEKPMKRAEAKRLGLKIDRFGQYTADCRYLASIKRGAEEYEIVIPPYELEKFRKYVKATLVN